MASAVATHDIAQPVPAPRASPGVTLLVSLLILAALGTLLLKTPTALAPGRTMTWLDAGFTAFSAATLTGLGARDTAVRLAPLGMLFIALIAQAAAILVMYFGSRVVFDLLATPRPSPRRLLGGIVAWTLIAEALGTLLIFALDDSLSHAASGPPLASAAFHALSAWTSAGFVASEGALAYGRHALSTHMVLAPLIVLGGLGYPVLAEVWCSQRHGRRLGPYARLVLGATAGLYVVGVAGLAVAHLAPYTYEYLQQGMEGRRTLAPMSAGTAGGILADASFLAVSARTAGLQATPIEQVQPAGRVVVLAMMVAGGSLGGAAGGLTTLVVVVLLTRGRVTLGAASSDQLLRAALTVALAFLAAVTLAWFLLCLSEPYPAGRLLFECVSAATNCGFSEGLTGDLSSMGQGVLMATMLIGRVLPVMVVGGCGKAKFK